MASVLPGFWSELPYALAGLAVLVLGLVVLALDRRSHAARAFAALCSARGLGSIADLVKLVDLRPARIAGATADQYLEVVIPFTALWFLAVYPRRRAWARPRWVLPAVAAAAGVAVATLALVAAPLDATERAALAAGPLLLVNAVIWALYGLILVALSRDLLATEPGRARASLALVHAAFAVIVARNTVAQVWLLASDLPAWELATSVANASVGVCAVGASLAVLARGAGPALRRTALLVVAVAAASLAAYYSDAAAARAIARGAVYMIFPALIAYALLRYHLFGIDAKVRWAIGRSTLAAAFVAVFFVVSETAQQLFSSVVGTAFGIGAAGLLLFALSPLQQAAERLASAVTPGGRSATQMSHEERLDAYRALVEHAWSDRVLSSEERSLLSRARDALQLSADDVMMVEERVLGAR